jgi:diol dehydratase reactivase ATPase-like protein/cobalamin-dependent diol dehydratase reactivating factor
VSSERGSALVAGIDIGNATTEIVLAREVDGALRPVAADQVPTRGSKGSESSITAAALLARRMAQRLGEIPARAAVARLTPVHTGVVTGVESGADTGRLGILPVTGRTLVHAGAAVGRPVPLARLDDVAGPVVALVPPGTGYGQAAEALNHTRADVVAVALADDEAVLVGNRLERHVPIIDQVPVDRLAAASLVALEVAPPGGALARLVDPLWLVSSLGLDAGERADATTVAGQLTGRACGLVVLEGRRPASSASSATTATGVLREATGAWRLADSATSVADLAVVDVTETAWPRDPGEHLLAAAYLRGADAAVDPSAGLADRLDVPVILVERESAMAVTGAASTPGADPGAAVLDLGAGTADLVVGGTDETRAGCGALLTLAVAQALRTTQGAAEWIKRGPCVRVEGPRVRVAETGERYLDPEPAPLSAVGRLAVPGPAGLLGFGGELPAATWRGARWALKDAVLGRALRESRLPIPETLVLVGGPAGDDEALAAVSAWVPEGTVVGRANVAGTLGHRYAVAWGLAHTAARS